MGQPGGCGLGSAPCNTQAYVDAVNAAGLCGRSDWRLPTRRELFALSDFGSAGPSIDQGYFPATINAYYWTASPLAATTPFAVWAIDARGEFQGTQMYGVPNHARLVAGPRATGEAGTACPSGLPELNPTAIYSNVGGPTVTDLRTGLTWATCLHGMNWSGNSCQGSPSQLTWQEAMALVTTGPLAGTWRLPSIKELLTLVEECRPGLTMNPTVFAGSPGFFVWSSSVPANGDGNADTVDFRNGAITRPGRDGPLYVRFVLREPTR